MQICTSYGHIIQQPSLHSSSGMPIGTKFTATYVEWLLNMHSHVIKCISACVHLVCVLCQPVHLCIEPSLHGVYRFLFRNLFMETIVTLAMKLINCTNAWCMIVVLSVAILPYALYSNYTSHCRHAVYHAHTANTPC